MDPVYLGDLVHEICERLDLDPDDVRRLDFTPGSVEVEIYLTKVSLKKGEVQHRYKFQDPVHGEAVMVRKSVRVETSLHK